MYLLFALILAALAYGAYPNGVFEIPLSQLTMSKIGSLVGAAILGFYALKNLSESFQKDRIWPTQWRGWRDPATLLIRFLLLCAYTGLFYYVLVQAQVKGAAAVCLFIGYVVFCLFTMFTSELQLKSPAEKQQSESAGDQST